MALVRYTGGSSGNKRRRICSEIEETEEDIFGNLPAEIIQNICSYLDYKDLRHVLRLPKWKKALNNDFFWKKKCNEREYREVGEQFRSHIYKGCLEKVDNYWQGVFLYNEGLHDNWINNNFTREKLNFESVHYCYYFDDEYIIIVKGQNKSNPGIYVLNRDMPGCQKGYKFFPMPSRTCFKFKRFGKYVCCAYLDRKKLRNEFTVWNIDDESIVFTGVSSKSRCIDMQFDESSNLFAVLYQESLKVINFTTLAYELNIEGLFSSMSLCNNVIAYSSKEIDIYIKNFSTGEVITFKCSFPLHWIPGLQLKGNYLLLIRAPNISRKGTVMVSVWNIKDRVELHTFGKFEKVYKLKDEYSFASKNYDDSEIRVWNFIDKTYRTIGDGGYKEFVRFTDHYVLCSYPDRVPYTIRYSQISIFCLKTGKFIRTLTYEGKDLYRVYTTNTKLLVRFNISRKLSHLVCIWNFENKILVNFP